MFLLKCGFRQIEQQLSLRPHHQTIVFHTRPGKEKKGGGTVGLGCNTAAILVMLL